jgi:methyl-galactoside transport system substrate-binding protein
MAFGALASIQAAGFNTNGKDSDMYIPVIGIDALPEALDKIKSGEMIGSVLQDARSQGVAIVKIAQNLAAGKDPVEGLEYKLDEAKAVRIPYKAITVDNINEAEETYAEN